MDEHSSSDALHRRIEELEQEAAEFRRKLSKGRTLEAGRVDRSGSRALLLRAAHAALQASELRYRTIVTTAEEGIWTADTQMVTTFANERVASMLGYTVEEMIGRPAEDFLDASARDEARQSFERRRRGIRERRDVPLRRKDGTVLWASVAASPLMDSDGAFAGSLVMGTDITERRDSEERFRAIFEGSRDAVFLSDEQGQFVAVNEAATELTGFSREELLEMRIPDLHDEPDLAVYRAFQRRILGGERILSEAPVLRKDGGKVAVEFNNNRVVIGGATFMHTVARDVTERKRAAEALVASEIRYRVLFENAAEGIVAFDLKTGLSLFHNPAVCAMFGYSIEEFGRLELSNRHPQEVLAGIRAVITSAGRGEHASAQAVPCIRKDGSMFQAEIRGSVVELEGRRVVFEFFTDVTARVRLEEQFRQAQKMEAIGQLAGGVAHDFNNLLTVILGNTDLLLSDSPGDDPKRGPLVDIHAAGERAASLTRQLLAFSRKQILDPKLVDVHEIIAGIEKMLRRLIGEDVNLSTDLAANPSWVKVDPGQLEQVVMNLIVNARDAMPRGGRLMIRTRTLEPIEPIGFEETASGRLRPKVAISISDTGTGIAPEAKTHLFEPFFTTKGVGKGTGLGLATVYGIVKQSGGDVTVESEPGKGATFTVVLPSQHAPRRLRGSDASLHALPQGTETVLVVEDEDAVRRIVKIALESTGYRVIEARSGPEALEVARRHADGIQLVVTDVVMPEMSGRELAERLRPEYPGLRVLYMSGYTDDAVMRHGIVDSGVPFLQKPFSPLALARKVREVLDGKAV